MFEKELNCYDCGKSFPTSSPIFRCKKCNGSLEVAYDYGKLRRHFRHHGITNRPFNHGRYKELFPVKQPIMAGEGGTPLIRSHNLEGLLKLKFQLYFKLEYQNPTGSFKDRGSSIELAKMLEFINPKRKDGLDKTKKAVKSFEQKKRSAVCASTGNMGASVAAYSGIANIKCSIFTPNDAAPIKLEQILAHGAQVFKIRGDYTAAAKLVEKACKQHGLYLLGDYLYRREGTKSVGFEMAEQMPKADFVFAPVGNGTLASAVWKGMKEMKALKLKPSNSNKLPKLVGVQASGCSPVTKAFIHNRGIRPEKSPHTTAVAIECGDPLDGKRALDSIKESKGFLNDVSDRQILQARELLAENEGIFPEPAGAASLAGLIKASDQGKITANSKVICLITGHGLKVPHTGVKGKPKAIKTNPSVLKKLF
jgi:threonine synthase